MVRFRPLSLISSSMTYYYPGHQQKTRYPPCYHDYLAFPRRKQPVKTPPLPPPPPKERSQRHSFYHDPRMKDQRQQGCAEWIKSRGAQLRHIEPSHSKQKRSSAGPFSSKEDMFSHAGNRPTPQTPTSSRPTSGTSTPAAPVASHEGDGESLNSMEILALENAKKNAYSSTTEQSPRPFQAQQNNGKQQARPAPGWSSLPFGPPTSLPPDRLLDTQKVALLDYIWCFKATNLPSCTVWTGFDYQTQVAMAHATDGLVLTDSHICQGKLPFLVMPSQHRIYHAMPDASIKTAELKRLPNTKETIVLRMGGV
ncbi:hypothetical protein [Absidia glauca]|uniref:Uncharacterized protein n=1 Tax=Absidia glauca TaxID=4829 RepID=A0A168QH11_ABSGL|nr:hypothetical protein [Absidia glauca]